MTLALHTVHTTGAMRASRGPVLRGRMVCPAQPTWLTRGERNEPTLGRSSGTSRPSRISRADRADRLWRRSAFLDQAWGVSVDQKTLTETIPQQLFAFSIIPYAGFLYHLTKSKQAPKLTLFGFYFLLVFVFATIPAGIYAKKAYQTTLANVDYLHGSAELMLTLTNLFIVIGLKLAIDDARRSQADDGPDALGPDTRE